MPIIRDAFILFLRHPSLRRFVWMPLALTLPIHLAISAGTAWFLLPVFQGISESVGLSRVFGTILYYVLWLFVSGAIFLTLASILSARMWDDLSVEVERLEIGVAPPLRPGGLGVRVDGGVRTGVSLSLAGCAVCCGWIMPVVLPVALMSVVCALDYTAPIMSRRGYTLMRHARAISKMPQMLPFAVTAGLITMVPLVNVLLLPVMVAAGTLTVLRSSLWILPPRSN